MYLVWLQFIIATIMILAVSGFLAKSADVIAFKTGLGRTFVGVLLLALAIAAPWFNLTVSSHELVKSYFASFGVGFLMLLSLYYKCNVIAGCKEL